MTVEANKALSSPPLDISAIRTFRDEQRRRPMWGYDAFSGSDFWDRRTARAADRVLGGAWVMRRFPSISVLPPVAWDEVAAANRSWHCRLQAWDHLGPVLATYDRTRERRYLDFARETALDWAERFDSLDTPSPFAWYDMATGRRAYRLAYLLDAAARDPTVADGDVAGLVACAMLHLEALADDERFTVHSNHGIYFAAGQAALARRFPGLPGAEQARLSARRRLIALIDEHFAADGVHKEHSPGYQLMVLDTLLGVSIGRLVDSPEFDALLERIQEALSWFIMPNRRFAMFGDTFHEIPRSLDLRRFSNPALRFALSDGIDGAPSPESFRVFAEGGYVVMRERRPSGAGGVAAWSYLAQACAFHSRQHKHADDLSFVWYDRGFEILTDGGRFGYVDPAPRNSSLRRQGFWYADPSRVFVESTAAHNTIEIDGQSFPRANVTPYGSAVRAAGATTGAFYSDSCCVHWNTISHRRTLVFRPAEWLLVLDELTDDASAAHRFVQRFNFAPELRIGDHENGRIVFELPTGVRLHVLPLRDDAELEPPVRGRRDTPALGWVSRREGALLPLWSVAWSAKQTSHHRFATLLLFAAMAPVPLGSDGLSSTWSCEGKTTTVEIIRAEDGELSSVVVSDSSAS